MSMKIKCNCLCYFPTTVAVIDDSQSFLAMINKRLDKKQPRLLFNNPKVALKKVNSLKKSNADLEYVLKNLSLDEIHELETQPHSNTLVDVNLKWLHQKIYDPERFNCIPVMLVDYSMPDMNGIELCQQIKDKTIKKILVTSMSDYRLAVRAFNDGVIDKFILKGASNLFDQINASILEAQLDYFRKLYGMDGILGFIFRNRLPFDQSDYREAFHSICKHIDFIEYYILDEWGSTLFLNEQGKSTWLMIQTEENLREFYSVAQDNHAKKNILTALKNKKSAPMLIAEEDYDIDVNNWHLYPLKTLLPNKKYFYSVITDKTVGHLDWKKIKSFNQAMKSFCR